MNCATCGQANPERAKFCLECGAPVAARCASCGTELPPAAKFCLECGTRTAAAPPAPSPPPATRGGSARKVVSIVFADLAGSTALQERLDAESTSAFMARYYAAMRAAVEGHGGTVVKLLGDGVMAAFGVPAVAEDDALRAVRAGVAMQDAFRALAGAALAATGDIGLRVAINTGEVVVNADHSDVVGDPVNIAARLQQEAGDGEVVLGAATQRLVASLVTLERLGSVALKGRTEAVQAYRVVSLARPAGAPTAAFVGRGEELARLDAVYDAAVATPAAALAVLVGSPGLGKSRLIDEFTRRHADAATVVTAYCDAAGGATFAPLAPALRELLGVEDGTGGEALRAAIAARLPGDDAERGRIASGIAALLAGSPASPEETFFVVRRCLAGLAQARPLVLVIDDLHWAEPLLLDLVEHLVQWGAGVPLLVLVGARPELRDLRSALVTPGGLVADVVTLAGLDAGAAMRLAANVIGAADLPAAVAAKVLATSEGNPLFVGELVRMLVQEGALTRAGDRWIVGAGLAALEMPPTIHALLAARIERLRSDERQVLECAAVVGRHFSRSAVAALLPREVADLDARLESLRRSELVERDSGWLLGEPALRFHHVLIRDAAYRRLLKSTRAELHGRLADWIEAQVGEAVEHDETIGWHLEQAHQLLGELGPPDAAGAALGARAASRLAAAGRRALAGDDVPLAAGLLGRAIARLDADDPARAELALDWCEALLAAGDVAVAATAIAELARCAALPAGTARCQRLRAWHTCFAGQLTVLTAPAALQATAEALAAAAAELTALADAAGEAKAHSVHAQALARLGRVGACEAALDKALAAARRAGDRRRANAVLAGAPVAALWGPSPVTRASGRCLDVVRVLRITQGAPAVEAVALSCQGVLEALRGRTDAARRMLASSRQMVEELGIAHRLHETDAFAGRIAAMEGDAAAAERLLRGAYDGLRELGFGIDAARAGALLARVLLAQDRAAEAEALSHESEALAGDDLQAAIAWRGARAEALARRGEHAAAIELAQAAVAIAAATDALLDHADARLALAAALRAAGRGAAADGEERRAIELWEAKGATLLAERVRRLEPRRAETADASCAALPSDYGVPGGRRPTPQRRVPPNAAIAAVAAGDAVLARSDLAAVSQLFAEAYEEVDHPTGSAYGKREALASVERLLRSRNASYRVEPLAVLGDRLMIGRRRIHASATGQGRFDVGEYENETVKIAEVDAHGLYRRFEIFAADRLGDAVARLYARYAETLPEGAAADRAAATARSLAVFAATFNLDRFAATFAPDIQVADHRTVGFGDLSGAEALLRAVRALLDLSAGFDWRVDDVFALRADAMVVCHTSFGMDRRSGGAFERSLCELFAFGADGRIARWERFDLERADEALARFDALGAGPVDAATDAAPPVRRRVRANAATAVMVGIEAAFAARDLDAVAALLGESMENVDHPTAATYGREGQIESSRRMMRTPGLALRVEALATLGDDLCLLRRRVAASGTGGGAFDVGAYEMEHVGILELDAVGRCRCLETFAADRLGDAVARFYERYAARLPDGPARQRAAAVARSVATLILGQVAATDPDPLAAILAPDLEGVDHRQFSTWSLPGAEAFLEHLRALRLVGDSIAFTQQDVLALEPAAILSRVMHSGTERRGGGAYERLFLSLFVYDDDGRLARAEWFDADRDAEALARFTALVATPAPVRPIERRVSENAATASRVRMLAAFAAQDADAGAAELSESLEFIDHPVGAVYDRASAIAGMQALWRGRDARIGSEPLAALGDAVCLFRRVVAAHGTGGGRFDVGAYEREDIALYEIDEHQHGRRIEIFAVDHLGDAVARLYARHAALLPEGPRRRRAAGAARSIERMYHGLVDRDRLASPFAPTVEWVDHRLAGVGTPRGDAAVLAAIGAFLELTRDGRWRVDDVLACSDGGYLGRATNLGTDRGGGAFERTIHSLVIFDADGLIVGWETFDDHRAAEALARYDALAGAAAPAPARRRRLRANAATKNLERFGAAIAARDGDALAREFSADLEVMHHPTGATYGRRALLATWRSMFRAGHMDDRREPMATLGDSLGLVRHRVSLEGLAEAHLAAFGVSEIEEIIIWEADEQGRCRAAEIFAPEQLGSAVARLYERYAELLPEGPARARVAAVARSLAAWNGPVDLDRLATAYAPSARHMDHRVFGTWSARDAAELLDHFRLQLDRAADFAARYDDVLALEAHALVVRMTFLGTARASGGPFGNRLCVLFRFGADGRVTDTEVFEAEQETEALARFAELTDRGDTGDAPEPFDNAASRAWRAVNEVWRRRDVERFAALHPRPLHYRDHRRLFQLDLDRDGFLAFTRPLIEMRTGSASIDLLATRGECLALMRSTLQMSDDVVGPSAIDSLMLIETDERGEITAYDRFDMDDLDAADSELDRRWQAGEAATHRLASTWLADCARCFAARDWNGMAAIMAPDLVLHSHRLVSPGTLHGPAGPVTTMQAQMERAPDTQMRLDHVRTCTGGVLAACTWRGSRDGGAFENLVVGAFEIDALGRARRVDLYEPEQLDQALARFDELAVGPDDGVANHHVTDARDAIATPTLATASLERAWNAIDKRDIDALRALCAADFTWADRRPLVGLSGDLELMIASAPERLASGAGHGRRAIIGTAGERVAIARVLWAGGPVDGRCEVEFLIVHEVDEAGRCTAMTFLDADDARAAQREAWARWKAIDPTVAEMTAALGRAIDGWNARDADRLRAAFAEDLVVDDHRRTGTGRSEGREAYLSSVVALWELAPESRLEAGWHWLAIAPHAGLYTARRAGTVPGGGEFESEFLCVAVLEGGRTVRVEIFEIDDVDAALARFEALRPDPLRVPPNAATGMIDRHMALVAAGDWDAVLALHAPGLVFDDRRKGLRTTVGGDGFLAGLRWAGPGVERTHTVLATAGDRLELRRNRFRRAREVVLFEIEALAVTEIDADGRLAAIVTFDPDDRAAAEAELSARYLRSGAHVMPPAVVAFGRALAAHDLAGVRAALHAEFVLDDHRPLGLGRIEGAEAYVASLAALIELSPDVRVGDLYQVVDAPHGRVSVARASGTNREGGPFETLYVLLLRYRAGRLARLEFHELENLDQVVARFAAIDPLPAG